MEGIDDFYYVAYCFGDNHYIAAVWINWEPVYCFFGSNYYSLICVGVALLALDMLAEERRVKRK